MSKRKKYTKEFKLDAIGLVRDQGYSQAEAARSLGINSNMLSRWITEHEKDDAGSFRGVMTEEQEQIRELQKRVKRLEMEKEILKKATVFFATETK